VNLQAWHTGRLSFFQGRVHKLGYPDFRTGNFRGPRQAALKLGPRRGDELFIGQSFGPEKKAVCLYVVIDEKPRAT
jgi:hypothetical protein